MKTTTTTPARVIFAAAHATTRAICAQFADADYRATFAAALRECYAAARAAADAETVSAESIAAAVMAGETPRAQYERMPAAEQIAAIRRAVCYALNRDRAETDRRGNFRPNYFNWVSCDDDIDNIAYDAWTDYMPAAIARAEQRAADDIAYRMPRLSALMVNAARNAARRIARAEIKHASALRYESMTDEDGNAYMREYIKDATTTERIAPAPYENAAIMESIAAAAESENAARALRAMLGALDEDARADVALSSALSAAGDDINAVILAMLSYGMKQREIAEYIGIRQPNVCKRVKAIRARYEENKRADTFDADILAHNIRKRINGAAGDVWTYRAV